VLRQVNGPSAFTMTLLVCVCERVCVCLCACVYMGTKRAIHICVDRYVRVNIYMSVNVNV